MKVVKLDILDGYPVEVVVKDTTDEVRLRRFSIDASDAFNDKERWEKMRELMTHEQRDPNVGWTLSILLPGDDPDDAIDTCREIKP